MGFNLAVTATGATGALVPYLATAIRNLTLIAVVAAQTVWTHLARPR